jgi:hypothetical protein
MASDNTAKAILEFMVDSSLVADTVPPCGRLAYNKKNINEISPEIKLLRFCQDQLVFQNVANSKPKNLKTF